MFGSMYLRFDRRDVGCHLTDKQVAEYIALDDQHGRRDNPKFVRAKQIIAATEFAGLLKPALALSEDNLVCLEERGTFMARVDLKIDLKTRRLAAEYVPVFARAKEIIIKAWVFPKEDGVRLEFGVWHNDDNTMGVHVENDGTEIFPYRTHIRVEADTVSHARLALFDTLSGKKKPNESWLMG